MQNRMKWAQWAGLGIVVLASAAGCADRNNNGVPDDTATPSEVAKTTDTAVKKTANALSGAGQTVENAAAGAGNEIKGAGKKIEGAADAALNTPKIKAALGNNPSLMGSNIDVDTNGAANTINLKGTVKNAAQSKLATSIAQKSAGPSYKISNQLKVSGGASPMMKKKM